MPTTAAAEPREAITPSSLEPAPSPHRSQTPWSLDELVPDPSPEAIRERLRGLENKTRDLEDRRGELDPGMDPARYLELLHLYQAWLEEAYTVQAYGILWFSSDTQSSEALSYRNRVERLLTELSNRLLFFSLWWRNLEDDQADRLLPTKEQDADARQYLLDSRRFKPYTLDEPVEKVINLKDADGIDAVVTLYSMLTNRLEFEVEIEGEAQTMTRDKLMSYAFSTKAAEREAAYRELYRVYGHEATVLGQIYTYRVRDWHNEQETLRGYSSALAVRNTQNDVPDAAVETLLAVTHENRGLFQRYFRLKAGWLGMDTLRRYDLYAPLRESDTEIPWRDAVTEVLTAFHDFHPTVGSMAERVFDQRHIDSEIRKGKRGGAFCSTVLPHLTPWVMVNFTGRMRDVAELAHELGHAVHSMLAEDHSVLTQHPSLPLAETASVFSEMLITDRLLARVEDPLARRELLTELVGDIYATVMRQSYFVRFELAAHEAILDGQGLPELGELYLENLADQFGDSVEVSDEFRYEWLSIPHIYHTPFYCYSYSFGQLLVLALYRRYQQEGEAFKPRYLKMLAYGGSARPQEILEEAGIDMCSRQFWQDGFDVVKDLVDELERTSGEATQEAS